MAKFVVGSWKDIMAVFDTSYTCGICDSHTSGRGFYRTSISGPHSEAPRILICTTCNYPTFFNRGEERYPDIKPGRKIQYLPQKINLAYEEARNCVSVGAYLAALMVCRKILLYIAADQGAEDEDLETFKKAVEYLRRESLITRSIFEMVDKIRGEGNAANHELEEISKADSISMISFMAGVLSSLYEHPGMLEEQINAENPS